MPETRQTKIAVPCPDCGEMTEELIENVASHDVIPCSLCGGLIDLTAADCSAQVTSAKNLSRRKAL